MIDAPEEAFAGPSEGGRPSHRRTLLAVLAGGPAILAAVGTLGVGVSALALSRETLIGRYTREVERAEKAQDPDQTRLCLERLTRLDPSEMSLVRLAQTLAGQGDLDRARAILTPLAPVERPGNDLAQLWVAQDLLRRGPLSAQQTREVAAHLTRALESNPRMVEARERLARLHIDSGRPDLAVPHLTAAVTERPELLMVLADTYRRLGSEDLARDRAQNARAIFSKRAEERPLDVGARLQWAWSLLFLGDPRGAQSALEAGLSLQEDVRLHRALANVLLARVEAAARDQPDALDVRLQFLEEGLRHDPFNPFLLIRLTRLLREEGQEAEKARERLEEILASGQGRTSGFIHFLLGEDAHQRGRQEEARAHWEAALRHSSDFPLVANNLAWLLTLGPKPDLTRALVLAEFAARKQPDVPQFRGTRGHVLAQLHRWDEALPELEIALRASPEDQELHRDLATTYESLSMSGLAQKHREWLRQREGPGADATSPP